MNMQLEQPRRRGRHVVPPSADGAGGPRRWPPTTLAVRDERPGAFAHRSNGDGSTTGRTAAEAVVGRLTPRQREVIALMAAGCSNAAIARRLVISEKAVVQHTSRIYDRLDLLTDDSIHRRVRAVVRYLMEAGHHVTVRPLPSFRRV